MRFSDEELIAYLLGDVDPTLAQQIQQALSVEPELLERLSQFRMVLGQIDSLAGSLEPPADLVEGTLARIDALSDVPQSAEFQSAEFQSAEFQPAVTPQLPASEIHPVLLNSSSDANPRRSSPWDSTALTISLTILCCLALPALVRIRFESRKAQCARNLTITGSELMQYALQHPQQRFPHVAVEGPASFAGVYAVYLHDMDAQVVPSQLRCSSLIGTSQDQLESTAASSLPSVIPSFAELQRMAIGELVQWQRSLGGDYAYNLGVFEKGNVRAPKCEGRSHLAILADAPVMDATAGRTAAVGNPQIDGEEYIAHEGKGINIFYEDGRVVFVTTASLFETFATDSALVDHPFRNQRGQHEIGLHPQDASLAPSHFPPLAN
jgi:hypothetical protein